MMNRIAGAMNANNHFNLQIQAIVDGECTHESRASFLKGLDTQPDGWRGLALALIEEQQWSKELLSKAPVGLQGSSTCQGRIQSPSTVASVQPFGSGFQPVARTEKSSIHGLRDRPWLPALAASLLMGLGFYGGSLWNSGEQSSAGGSADHMASSKPSPVSGNTKPAKSGMVGEDSRMRMVVSGPNDETSEIPIYDFNQIDREIYLAKEKFDMAEMNKRLRLQGYELDVRPEYYTGKLDDGRQLIVPVKHVGLKPYGL